jgi:hypothetical protein
VQQEAGGAAGRVEESTSGHEAGGKEEQSIRCYGSPRPPRFRIAAALRQGLAQLGAFLAPKSLQVGSEKFTKTVHTNNKCYYHRIHRRIEVSFEDNEFVEYCLHFDKYCNY